tara:strand:- start:7144 stop:7455 length:312 start_codon:yes stop_codon:yes gene_type:complete
MVSTHDAVSQAIQRKGVTSNKPQKSRGGGDSQTPNNSTFNNNSLNIYLIIVAIFAICLWVTELNKDTNSKVIKIEGNGNIVSFGDDCKIKVCKHETFASDLGE